MFVQCFYFLDKKITTGMFNINTYMNIFYAIGLEMVFMAMGFYYVLLTVLQFSKILQFH